MTPSTSDPFHFHVTPAIQREYPKLLDYQDQPILIHCATGNRSTVTVKILIDKGFEIIYNMRYGLAEWKARSFTRWYMPGKRNRGDRGWLNRDTVLQGHYERSIPSSVFLFDSLDVPFG